uniref:Stimulator of interferon genes protein n=1 Tax=Dicentrarchus labrax TaxID=13489 RepID=A0A8C4HYE1_DICLA
MQCHQDQEALIPRPRGALPKACAAALFAVTMGVVLFLSPERLFGWVGMVILTLTLGPLLHGVCLLAEEMLYHSNTRKMNVAHGLAWSFYLGYLRLVLPRLEESIAAFSATHQASKLGRGSRKLLILVPLNANISHKLEDEDDRISFFDNLPNNEIDRAGVRGRVYKHSVYRVLDEQKKAHECVVEYATPLLTLYSMSQETSAGFGEPERRQQVLLFYRTLQDILEHSLECRNRYRLILLNDEHEDDPNFLSKALLRHLQQQEKEEFFLPPQQEMGQQFDSSLSAPPSAPPMNGEWHNPEPMSREPTLMFSLERPQPLREPVENTDIYPGRI